MPRVTQKTSANVFGIDLNICFNEYSINSITWMKRSFATVNFNFLDKFTHKTQVHLLIKSYAIKVAKFKPNGN